MLVSPSVGSFLAVLVDRLVTRRSVVSARSACDACGAVLAWRDMVPILSGLMLKGRCRRCGATIPGHLLRMEIAAFLAAFLCVVLFPGTVQMWLIAGLFWCLIALFYSDLLHMRLPDPLTLVLFLLGMGLAATDPVRGWQDGLLSAAIGVAAFWIIRALYFAWRGREGLGLGDVKLMAGIGAAVGWQGVPAVTLVAALLALAIAAMAHLRGQTRMQADARLPFGSALTAATVLAVLVTAAGH